MKLRALLLALVATALAVEEKSQGRPVRAPKGPLKYDDVNAAKVNWQYSSPDNQYRTEVENTEGKTSVRLQRADSHTAVAHRPRQVQGVQAHPVVQAQPNYQQYQPYSAVPTQIRQLILQAFPEPHKPYVNPSSFLYNTQFAASPQYEQQSAAPDRPAERYGQLPAYGAGGQQKSQFRRDHNDRRTRLQGKIEYTPKYPQQQESRPLGRVTVPIEFMPAAPPPRLIFDKNMPMEIQQLLQYQAQIPYDVTANKIIYTPKKLFIPKPLPEEDTERRGPYYYRSKIYYMRGDEIEPEYETSTPARYNSRH